MVLKTSVLEVSNKLTFNFHILCPYLLGIYLMWTVGISQNAMTICSRVFVVAIFF